MSKMKKNRVFILWGYIHTSNEYEGSNGVREEGRKGGRKREKEGRTKGGVAGEREEERRQGRER